MRELIKHLLQSLDKPKLTNVYGLARSLCAFGLLIILISNSPHVLFTDDFDSLPSLFGVKNEIVKSTSLFDILGYENIWVSYFLAIFILIVVVIGYRPRYTGFLHLWVHYSFYVSCLNINGGTQIAMLITFYLLPITLLDGRKYHWQPAQEIKVKYLRWIVANWIFLLRIQCCVVYLDAAVAKFSVKEWADGTSLYYWMNNHAFGLPSHLSFLSPIFEDPLILPILTYGVLIFELILAMGLLISNEYKSSLLLFGLIFHLGIAVCFGLVGFFFSMAALLVVYLRPWNKEFEFQNINFLKRFKRPVNAV